MSQVTREINKVTSTIIGISGKLIIYAVVILLLVEGMTRGYAFGHSIFYSTPMEEAPGTEKTVTIAKDQSAADTARMLKELGLVSNDLAVLIQMKFYDYDIYPGTYTLSTAMTSKEILQLLNEKPKEDEEDGQPAQTDAGNQTNTGNESDAGNQTDTGNESDAGDQMDTGDESDTGNQTDADLAGDADDMSGQAGAEAPEEADGAGEPEVEIRINGIEADGRLV